MPDSRPRVGCRVTFITGPVGSPNVSPCIHNLVNMMDKFPGDGYVVGFEGEHGLVDTLLNYVSSPDEGCECAFQLCSMYLYSFLLRSFNGGSIYGLKKKRNEHSLGQR